MKFCILSLLLTPFIVFSQQTYVPDDEFENYLESNSLGNGVPNDDFVLTSNINTVTTLWINSMNISDLTGIEDFTSLNQLFCYNNNLTELDLSNNLGLTHMFAHANLLSCIEVWDTAPFINGSINLNVDPLVSFYVNNNSPINLTYCESYWWSVTDSIYYTSGIYTFDTTNVNGCDSTVTLNLTIDPSTTSTSTHTSCDSYLWNGVIYTLSGTYTFDTINSNGCDSTVTLNLTIDPSTTSTSTHTSCDSYLWNGVTYTSSGTYTFDTTNVNGCDSTVTLDLTINNSTTSTDTQVACDTYTWLDGVTYTTSNSTATHTTTNASGCDNVATLDLTINNSTISTDTQVACDSYTWLDGVTYTNSNSTATFTSTNASGCDNVATLNLIINPFTTSTFIETVCYNYLWNGTTYTSSGSYTYSTLNSNGCDSIATLNLTINTVIASINQLGDSLFAITTPFGLDANWYNIQTEDSTHRIWLMEEDTNVFLPTFDCSYFIVVTDDNGCVDTSLTYNYAENAARISSLTTYPNPTRGLLNVKFDNPKNQFVTLELISSNGVKLDEFVTEENYLDIDLSKYSTGIYYLYFNSENSTQGCSFEEYPQKIINKIILNK